MILYLIYVVMTVINIILLLIGGMDLLEAVCTAFGTAGTGGFGIKADSIAGYSPYLQWVITIGMLAFGVNFNIYFLLLLLITLGIYRDIGSETGKLITTWILCICGGMAGGMIS